MWKCRTALSGASSALCADWPGHRPAALPSLCCKMLQDVSRTVGLRRKKNSFQIWYGSNGLCRAMTSTHLIWNLLGPAGLSPDRPAAVVELCVGQEGAKTGSTLLGMLHLVWTWHSKKVMRWNQVSVRKFLNSDYYYYYFLVLKSLVLTTHHRSLSCQWGMLVLPLLLLCTNSSLWWVATHTVSRWLRLPRPASFPLNIMKGTTWHRFYKGATNRGLSMLLSVEPGSFASLIFYWALCKQIENLIEAQDLS